MSWQQQYQPFADDPSAGGGYAPSTAPPGQQQHQQQRPQHQQHQQQQGGGPHPPQPQPIQHASQPDPSTYAQAGYYQPGQGSQGNGGGQHRSQQQQQQQAPPPAGAGGQASRRSTGPGGGNGQGEDGEYGHAESGSSAAGSKESGETFEFMRRKKWAQLLIEELHDTAIIALLPLSNGGAKILYASSGIKELTGFSSKELENLNLGEIVHEPDLPALSTYINESISTRTDLASYHRFKCVRPPAPRHTDSSASDVSDSSTDVVSSRGTRSSVNDRAKGETRPVLMEVRGHGFWGEEAERLPVPVSLSLAQPPRSAPSDGSTSRPSLAGTQSGSFSGVPGPRCKAFFLMVRRWPSPAVEMASTFLAEKIENERLRAELLSLEGPDAAGLHGNTQAPPPPLLEGEFGSAPGGAAYPFQPQLRHQHSYGSAYDDSAIGGGAYDDDDSDKEFGAPAPAQRAGPSAQQQQQQQQQGQQASQQQQQQTILGKEHPSELGKKSKKSKKSKEEGNYVCVTCGRTDSPEWRKGPLGPKTLCNACGLRYAKKQQMQAAADGTGPPVPPKKKAPPKPAGPGAGPPGGGGEGQAGQ